MPIWGVACPTLVIRLTDLQEPQERRTASRKPKAESKGFLTYP